MALVTPAINGVIFHDMALKELALYIFLWEFDHEHFKSKWTVPVRGSAAIQKSDSWKNHKERWNNDKFIMWCLAPNYKSKFQRLHFLLFLNYSGPRCKKLEGNEKFVQYTRNYLKSTKFDVYKTWRLAKIGF